MKGNLLGYFVGSILLLLVASAIYFKYQDESNKEPTPEHEISLTCVPSSIVTVRGQYRGKDYIIGYRIIVTDDKNNEYVVISTLGGLIEDNRQVSGSPGMVPKAITASFAEVVEAVQKNLKDKLPIGIYGDLLYEQKKTGPSFSLPFFGDRKTEAEEERKPLLFEDKKVILLYGVALYGGKEYNIDRKIKDND